MANGGKETKRRGKRLFAALRRQDPTPETIPEAIPPEGGASPEPAEAIADPDPAPSTPVQAAPDPAPDTPADGVTPVGDALLPPRAQEADESGRPDVAPDDGSERQDEDPDRTPDIEPVAPGLAEADAETAENEQDPEPTEESMEEEPAVAAAEPDEPEELPGEIPGPPPGLPEPDETPIELPVVLAIANQKGGVGKTTTAVNLGAALAEEGFRVLVVDLDPQGNATTGLGVNHRDVERSVYDVVMNDVPMEDCIEASSLKNLFVVPATIDLAGAEIELVPAFSRELKLRRAIESVKEDYDFTLIDCPPSLGLLTVNGLAGADDVIVPIQCEYYALEGLGQLLRNVALVRANLNPTLDVRGIVLTMYDARTKLADQVEQEVRNHFGSRVYRTVIPRTVRLSEAPSFGQPIIVFDPTSRGAGAYRDLAKEVSHGAARRSR